MGGQKKISKCKLNHKSIWKIRSKILNTFIIGLVVPHDFTHISPVPRGKL